jgi:hypothetical protein
MHRTVYFVINMHIVVQQAMEPDVAERTRLLKLRQMALPVGAQAFICSTGSYANLPYFVQILAVAVKIYSHGSLSPLYFR